LPACLTGLRSEVVESPLDKRRAKKMQKKTWDYPRPQEAAREKCRLTFRLDQRLRSRLMVLEGLNWLTLKKCISLESFQSTNVFIFFTPTVLK